MFFFHDMIYLLGILKQYMLLHFWTFLKVWYIFFILHSITFIVFKGSVVPTKLGKALPLMIFGAVGILAGMLALTLPETVNTSLPESVEDAKVLKRYKTKYIWFDFIVLNATFSNMSAISWRPVLVVEDAGVPGVNHRPGTSNW